VAAGLATAAPASSPGRAGPSAAALPRGSAATPAPSWAGWADWVGDWAGKLTWAGCTLDGHASASLAFDATDGAIAIDLTPAGGALGPMSLVETDPGWQGQHGDVSVRLARGNDHGNDHTVELAVELESGCAMHATLQRSAVGIAACDELAAWARIEEHCTKLAKPRLESLARLVRQRAEWHQARGELRPAIARQCKGRAAKVEAELIEAGCAPDPNPAAMRGPECHALRQTAAKLARCSTLPFALATSLAHDANQLASAVAGAESETSLRVVERQCREMRAQITEAGLQAGCAM
ncbi:MAG: hypothetical protein ABI467_18405, partial [Kofleriaceae bacterium]